MPTAVCCLDEAGSWAHELEDAGIRVFALKRQPGFQRGLGRQVAAVAREHGATVQHAHHYSPFVYSAMSRLHHAGSAVVFTEHGRLSDVGPSAKRRLANRVLRRFASRVFTVSEDVRQHLIAEGFRSNEVSVIYNGIEIGPPTDARGRTEVRCALGVSDTDFVIGTVARLDPVKDLGTLLDAASELGRSGLPVTLAIVGDGPERASLEARVSGLGLTARVRFLGHRRDARWWLNGCDVYVNSSISEGVSLTILEAMAASLPVVATRVGGTPEVVTDQMGVLVPPRAASELAVALAGLVNDDQRRQRLGEYARRRVEAHFALSRMVREYADAYETTTRPVRLRPRPALRRQN